MTHPQPRTYVSVVDPPNVEPVLAVIAPTIHDGQLIGSITLATARNLIKKLEAGLRAAERSSHDRT